VHPWAFHWLHEIFIPKRVRHRLEPEWEMRRTGWGGSTGCIMHQVHTSWIIIQDLSKPFLPLGMLLNTRWIS
jgi:hypothetical protein